MRGAAAEKTPVKENLKARSAIQLPPNGIALLEVERELVRQALEQAGGNQTRAAELLGIERDALRRRLIKHGFHHPHPNAAPGANPRSARPSTLSKDADDPLRQQHGSEQSVTEHILPAAVGKGSP